MSDKSKTPEQWKSTQQRAERKARLASMKAKDGGKRQIKTSNPLARWLVIGGLLVILLFVGLWALVNSGTLHKKLTAALVGPVEVSAADINYYYYQSLVNRYGLDPADPDTKETLKAPSGMDGFKTNADFIKDQALQELQGDVMLADLARKEEFELDAEMEDRITSYLAGLRTAAEREGKTLDNLLITSFGPGMDLELLADISRRLLLADQYASSKITTFSFSDEELEAAYAKDPQSYDVVDYRVFPLAADVKTGATDAEKTKAMEEAEQKAQAMLAKITDDESFRLLCQEYAGEDDKDLYKEKDISLQKSRHLNDVAITVQRNWLFADERKPGDKTVLESTSGYYVLLFGQRSRPDYARVDVRHILISVDKNKATEEELAAAHQKAEAVWAEYRQGEQTEDAFAELAVLNSDDGNAALGGLYTGVFRGQMVSEFEDWCFDPQRQPGDTGLVQTDFGYHVMYYAGTAGIDWVLSVEQTLRSEAFEAFVEEELGNYAYTIKPFGYRFVG